ncbi:MAG: glycosyltransferase family 2 protein [Candidatus Aureabacteria bacterium]|nr:glycosyltransferase family 2 protein [Candidatus Auribacterota bacterium]
MIRLSIIIVNWNTEKILKKCLSLILKNIGDISYEIIVVDNASSDRSVVMLEENFPDIKIIRNRENTGFARANNAGIKEAKGDLLLLLNPDCFIEDGTLLEKWLEFMSSHTDTGISGCKLVFPDGRHQVGDAGYKPSFFAALNYYLFLSKIFPFVFKGLFLNSERYARKIEVDWICGAACMVRKAILNKTGLLDEKIFMFSEDIEWGCRIKSFGFKVYYLPFLKIIHLQGSSVNMQDSNTQFSTLWLRNLRNIYAFFNKHPLIFYDITAAAGFFIRFIIYYSTSLFTGNKTKKNKAARMGKYLIFTLRNMGKPANM